jgi:hypothetical protein
MIAQTNFRDVDIRENLIGLEILLSKTSKSIANFLLLAL